MQLQNELMASNAPGATNLSFVGMASKIARSEGPLAFFAGLPAAMLRQASYGGLCFAAYPEMRNALAGSEDAQDASLAARLGAGALSGGLAAALANPTDVAKVRVQADGRLRLLGLTPRYTGTLDAFRSIARDEGLAAFYKGTLPNLQRAAFVNGCGIAAYDQSKQAAQYLLGESDSLSARFVAALVGGCVTSLVGCPFDVLKTRLMNEHQLAPPTAAGGAAGGPAVGPTYSGGMLGAMTAIVRTEGVLALWKGLLPVYCRQAPFNLLNYLILEWCTVRMLGKSGFG